MADVKEKILSKYDINIDKINVLNLYKVESADISSADLEIKIEKCRKKWEQSINGANEKFAERDKLHLENADKYEQILRNKKLREELFKYYKGASSNSNTVFAKEYFKMIESTKKIDKKDVDFFFKYFQNERKNRKHILEMLKTEFKVHGLGREEKFATDGEDVEVEGKKKNESSPLITNLFQEATIIKIHKCEQFLENASKSIDVKNKYPNVDVGLYVFLEMDKHNELVDFVNDITKRREEAANYRLDRGQDFTPIVDFFNTMVELATYKDVVDNFYEFGLLLKYPKLSPYMYVFSEIKPNSLKEFFAIANKEYPFRDLYDFVLSYFQPLYDNFGILDKGIGAILKKAEKKAKTNKVLNAVDDVLGFKKRRKLSLGAEFIHYAVYWPIYLLYLVFETFKAIITEMRKVAYPLFVIIFIGMNWLAGDKNLLILRHIFNNNIWTSLLNAFVGEIGNRFELIAGSLIMILAILMIFIIPPFFISLLFYHFSEEFSHSVDWIGLERTFQEIFVSLRNKTEKQYNESKKVFFKKKMLQVLINVLCAVFVTLLVHFVPLGIEWLCSPTDVSDIQANVEETIEEIVYIEITAIEANVRSGIGTSHDVITVVKNGALFMWTGSQGEADDGKIWYEIYLDESRNQTGWVSMSVAQFVEK